jgi:hypothetical protein
MLSSLGGTAVLVAVPFDQAKRWVQADQADELSGLAVDEQTYGRPAPLTSIEGGAAKPGGCGCGGAGAVDVAVVGTQKTEVAFAGRGRLMTGNTASEPLFAVAEPSGDQVACCGSDCGDGSGTPNALIFDRYVAKEGGGYEVKSSTEHAFPEKLAGAYAKREHNCLPWVRIEQQNPETFKGCLAELRALGPIKNSKKVAEIVGKFMSTKGQEIFVVILIDTQLQCRGLSEIARGARDRVEVPTAEVLRIALVDGATGIIVCHNHPSGVVRPSDSDVALTKTIQRACKEVDLVLLDHVILAGSKHYSFAKAGKLGKT